MRAPIAFMVMVMAMTDAAHAATWILSCSGTKQDISNNFKVEQVPDLLISVDWDAQMVSVLMDQPQFPALVLMVARPDFIEARGFFLEGTTPKEIRLASHIGGTNLADGKTSIITARPGDLNRMDAAVKRAAKEPMQVQTYSTFNLTCNVIHVLP
jgi:hypothetical protein